MCLTKYYIILMTHYCQLKGTSDLNSFTLAVVHKALAFVILLNLLKQFRKDQMEMNILNA